MGSILQIPSSKDQDGKLCLVFLENFLDMLLAERSASVNTITAYRNDIVSLINFLLARDLSIHDVNYNELVEYITYLNVEHFANSTLSRKISAIRQFFHFLMTEHIRGDNPTSNIELPKRVRHLPKALSQQDINILLEAVYKDNSVEGIRNIAMLEILYATGMRISELVTLKMQMIECNAISKVILNRLLIKGKGGKERIVLLNDTAVVVLQKYLSVREYLIKSSGGKKNDWLFPSLTKNKRVTHMTRQRFGQILKALAMANGIDPSIVSPHKIRHSFASHMLQNGANLRIIQDLLGHASITSTQIYTKVYDDKIADLFLNKHPLARRHK
ncbi:Tyrosine recombinase XerD [Alphaproteobacteria bacterium]